MSIKALWLIPLLTFSFYSHASSYTDELLYVDKMYSAMKTESVYDFIANLDYKNQPFKELGIKDPLNASLFPPDIASIPFIWKDHTGSTAWLLSISLNNEVCFNALLDKSWWLPQQKTWERLKRIAAEDILTVKIYGIGGWDGQTILSENKITFSFSKDPVDANIMFMRKPLPFLYAKQHPEETQILLGDISSYVAPQPIMSEVKICTNCHTYSLNGEVFAMDVDYGGDKGAFAMASTKSDMVLDQQNIFSWNNIPVKKPAKYSMGLFSQLSPSGRYLAGTVNETSVFVMMDDLYFSQLFFPATGQIAIFDKEKDSYKTLKGADLKNRVQTAPSFSPDTKTVAFSVAPIQSNLIKKVLKKKILKESPKQNIKDLNKKYPVQFDIYTVPFNSGKGGVSKPLKGASKNGKSNYFPRYSPDGKWMVFTQSPTGLVLQPESKLCIIPAKGGTPRYLESNMDVMNSWHSWSVNSKWIVFTGKAYSPYTELYITHISDTGKSSPAVRLFRFSDDQRAAMVPEFLSTSGAVPETINFILSDLNVKDMAVDGR